MISIITLCFLPLVTGLSINGFPPTVTPGEVVTITWFRDTGDPQNWHLEFVQDNQIIGDILDPASHAAKSADMTLTVPPEATGAVELLAFSDLADPTFFFTQPIPLPTSSGQDSPSPSPGGTSAESTPTSPTLPTSPTGPTSSPSKTQTSKSSTNSVSDDSTSTTPPPDPGDDDPDTDTDDPDQNQNPVHHNLITIIAVPVLGVVLLLGILAVFLYRRWRHRAGRRAYLPPDYETPSSFHPENMVRTSRSNVRDISTSPSSRSESELESSSGSDLKGSGGSSYRMHSISTVPVMGLGRTQSPPPYTPSDSNPPTSFDSAEFMTHYSASVVSGRIPR